MEFTKNDQGKLQVDEVVNSSQIMKADDSLNSICFIFDDEPYTFVIEENKVKATLKAAFREIDNFKKILTDNVPEHLLTVARAAMHDAIVVHTINIEEPISYKGCKTPEEKETRAEETKLSLEEKLLAQTDSYYSEIAKKVNRSVVMSLALVNSFLMGD
jgi:hypothetical protein